MRRILLSTIASTAATLALPGVALAHGHHHARHASAHRRHHAHVRVLDFVAGKAPAPASETPPTTTPPSGEVVATVTTFKEGVLTITLNDGTTVSGKVTERTELECHPAQPEEASTNGSDDGGEDGGAPPPSFSGHGDDMSGGGGDRSVGDDGEEASPPSCTTAALVPGAKLREAELSVGSQGAVWEKLDLIQ